MRKRESDTGRESTILPLLDSFGVRLSEADSLSLSLFPVFADAKAARQWGKALKLVDPNIKVSFLKGAVVELSLIALPLSARLLRQGGNRQLG
jgi:hypothetical protein